MKNKKINIIPFQVHHQDQIDKMMADIAGEFTEPISSSSSKKIREVATLPTHRFWVALYEHEVIGTIGLATLSNQSIVLKSMFLSSHFRGLGVGRLLLEHLKKWCFKHDYTHIYLGTMSQFKGGQQFYERTKFKLISTSDLPDDFPINPLDSLYYCLVLQKSSVA